jgi:hypothetical protein
MQALPKRIKNGYSQGGTCFTLHDGKYLPFHFRHHVTAFFVPSYTMAANRRLKQCSEKQWFFPGQNFVFMSRKVVTSLIRDKQQGLLS